MSKGPKSINQTLPVNCKLKSKSTGAFAHYLECNFFRVNNEILSHASRKHVKKIASSCKAAIGCKLNTKVPSSLKKGEYSELDA